MTADTVIAAYAVAMTRQCMLITVRRTAVLLSYTGICSYVLHSLELY